MNAWIREGLVTETTATGPKGNPFKVLTLTRKAWPRPGSWPPNGGWTPAST